MDYSQTVTHIGLCAGYGGIELGLKRAIPNLRSVALCEIEAFAIANLVAKMEAGFMDPAPIWPDLRTFPWGAFHGKVDILTGGYPCQPFSSAGKRAGKEDPRHLWPWIADGVRLLRPKLCFFENVEGHISLGLSDVIEDLAGMGYRTTWGIFSASECGAPHQRKRVFILADRYDGRSWENIEPAQSWSDWPQQSSGDTRGSGCQVENGKGPIGQGAAAMADSECDGDIGDAWPSRPGEQQYGWEPPRVVGNTILHGHASGTLAGGTCQSENQRRVQEPAGGSGSMEDTQRCGGEDTEPQHSGVSPESGGCHAEAVADGHRLDRGAPTEGREHDRQAGSTGGEPRQRQTQPPLGGDADGVAGRMDYAELCVSGDNRTDELRLLGNGVVPATAERAFRVLIKELP